MLISEALLQRFVRVMKQRLAAPTVKTYLLVVRSFLLPLSQRLGRPVQAQDLTREQVQAWVEGLRCDANTVATRASGLLRFLQYVQKEEDPAAPVVLIGDLALRRTSGRPPKPLSVAQSEALCRAAFVLPCRQGLPQVLQLRDAAILEVLSTAGLRGAEARALDVEDVRLDYPGPGLLTLRIEGPRTPRLVPLGGTAAQVLRRYLERRSELAPPKQPALFVTRRSHRINPKALWLLVHACGQRVGLEVRPHLLRLSFAAQLLSAGADLRAVQQLLGHQGAPLGDQDLPRLYQAGMARHPRCGGADGTGGGSC